METIEMNKQRFIGTSVPAAFGSVVNVQALIWHAKCNHPLY